MLDRMVTAGRIRHFPGVYAAALGIAGAGLAGLVWWGVANSGEQALVREEGQRFGQLSYEVTTKVEQAHNVLRGLQGVFMASDVVTREDFHHYARALQIEQGKLGLQAVQFARLVPQAGRDAFEAAVRADRSLKPAGYPDFRIVPPGQRAFYVATEFNEPMAGNEGAFGFDTAFGPARMAVLGAARDSGQAMASAPFELVQTGKMGLVMRAPVYRHGASLADVAQRREAFVGQVSVVFAADTLLGTALGHHLAPGTEIRLTDTGAVAAAALTQPTDTPLGRYGLLPEPSAWRQERLLSESMVVQGRFWRLEMRTRPINPLLQAEALTAGLLVLAITMLGAGMVKRATDQRDRAQARSTAVLGATLTGIIAVDAAGRIRSANPAACSLFGYAESDLLGQPFSKLAPDTAMPPVGTVRNIVGVTADGQSLDLALSVGEVGDAGDRQFLASFHDISIEKRIQQQQRSFARELEATVESRTADLTRVNQELEAFAYSVAHDLRAPARHVHGFARVLELRHSGALDPQARHFLDRILAASLDMGRLIDDLLAFSQVNHHELALVDVDLNEVMARCLQKIAPELEGRVIEWRIGSLPRVHGDESLLAQVLSNLVGNAVKYSARSNPSVIEIFQDTSVEGEHRVCVRDNGVGIDMQYAHRLFKVFSRLHHRDEFEGTGVGLANVRRIIERHGGRVWVESEVGKGAAFWLALPAENVTV